MPSWAARYFPKWSVSELEGGTGLWVLNALARWLRTGRISLVLLFATVVALICLNWAGSSGDLLSMAKVSMR